MLSRQTCWPQLMRAETAPLCCDEATTDDFPNVVAEVRYLPVWGNMRAVSKTIEALRSIERSGASHLLERALTAFDMLAARGKSWWNVFEWKPDEPREVIEAHCLRLVREGHPDSPSGSHAAMTFLHEARDAGLAARR